MYTVEASIRLPREQLQALAASEFRLREPQSQPPGGAVALTDWTVTLEFALICAALNEAIAELELKTVAELIRAGDRVDALVRRISRLDPAAFFTDHADRLSPSRGVQLPADSSVVAEAEPIVRAVRSLLLHCPYDLLQASRAIDPAMAHRLRLAHAGLRAFVARHSSPPQLALASAGKAYAEGRLTVDEVGNLLDVDVADAVALLEEHGFRRSIDDMRLDDAERAQRLTRIRDDRLARNGAPAPDDARVAREVIASQRVEDIDARPWLVR